MGARSALHSSPLMQRFPRSRWRNGQTQSPSLPAAWPGSGSALPTPAAQGLPPQRNQPDRQPPHSHPLAAASPPGLCQLRALHPETSAPFTRKGLRAAGGDGRGSVRGLDRGLCQNPGGGVLSDPGGLRCTRLTTGMPAFSPAERARQPSACRHSRSPRPL